LRAAGGCSKTGAAKKIRERPLVELIILACLLKEPQHCEEFHVPFMVEMNVFQCLWQSTIHAAEWASEHPGWSVRKVSCGQPTA
jgi:hypothetical protein